MKPRALWLLGSFLAVAGYPAAAQLSDGSTICLVEPMPELPRGGGLAAIVAAIERRVVYPPPALRAGAEGHVFLRFAVTPAGYVRDVSIIQAFRRDCGFAAARAVRQLPRFRPRRQSLGEVKYIVPVSFKIAAAKHPIPRPRRKKALSSRSAAAPAHELKFSCYFEAQPELLVGGGGRAVVAAVQQRLVYPPHTDATCLAGRAFVKFTITPAGEVRQVVVVRGLWPSFDSAAVHAVRQLPCFKPMPRAMFYVVPVTYGSRVSGAQ